MKNLLIYLFLLVLVLTACHKTKADVDSNSVTPTPDEPVVKKYLVKQLLNDDTESVMLAIDWNDDYTKIMHVKYGLGYGGILDYDFKYYDKDSICVLLSMPPDSYPLWSFWYDSIVIHLFDDKIDSICCYDNGTVRHIEHYCYDELGRIIERTYLFGTKDTFVWNNDNVTQACIFGNEHEYYTFTNYYHPHCNIPYYLSNFVRLEIPKPLFTPLWKYMPDSESFDYEADDDNYVVKVKSKITDSFYTYYYSIKTD